MPDAEGPQRDREPCAFELQDHNDQASVDLLVALQAAAAAAGAHLLRGHYERGLMRLFFDRPIEQESIVDRLVLIRSARAPVDREPLIVA